MSCKRLVVGGVVWALAAPVLQAAEPLVIPEGCDPTVVVALAPRVVCQGGNGAEDFFVQPLLPCDITEKVADGLRSGGEALFDLLARTAAVGRRDGGALTGSDLEWLERAGYVELAPTCDMVAMGSLMGGGVGASLDAGDDEHDRWQMVETGALNVVTYLQEVGVDSGLDFQRPTVAVVDSGVDPVVGEALLEEGWAYPGCSAPDGTPCWWWEGVWLQR